MLIEYGEKAGFKGKEGMWKMWAGGLWITAQEAWRREISPHGCGWNRCFSTKKCGGDFYVRIKKRCEGGGRRSFWLRAGSCSLSAGEKEKQIRSDDSELPLQIWWLPAERISCLSPCGASFWSFSVKKGRQRMSRERSVTDGLLSFLCQRSIFKK